MCQSLAVLSPCEPVTHHKYDSICSDSICRLLQIFSLHELWPGFILTDTFFSMMEYLQTCNSIFRPAVLSIQHITRPSIYRGHFHFPYQRIVFSTELESSIKQPNSLGEPYATFCATLEWESFDLNRDNNGPRGVGVIATEKKVSSRKIHFHQNCEIEIGKMESKTNTAIIMCYV